MSLTPYMSEIKMFSFDFAPRNWAQCNGQLLPINQNQALFSLLGTTYGGNGQTTFALPDLRGRVPVHVGGGIGLGQQGGTQSHTISLPEMAAHTHLVTASASAPAASTPNNNFFASDTGFTPYGAAPGNTAMAPECCTQLGGSQPHENRSPYLVLIFGIALSGMFPTRN